MKIKIMAAGIAILSLATVATAEPLPQEKHGICPSGWTQSGNYCAPMPGAHNAVPKVGQCPSGWTQSGGYCREMQGEGLGKARKGSSSQ